MTGAPLAGADRIFALGGVQALAAMAFGLAELQPVDMIVGPGHAYVVEAKRQLYGRVGIDLLAGPSEIAVIADESADPELMAADLLGQAERGPTSPAALVTTPRSSGGRSGRSRSPARGTAYGRHGRRGPDATAERSSSLPTARPSSRSATCWRAAHLQLQTDDDDDEWYHARLRNYGLIFLGSKATVAFSDKGVTGTNHVLPTGRAARYTGGLCAARFLLPLTFRRIDDGVAASAMAEAVVAISQAEGLAAHGATAPSRMQRVPAPWEAGKCGHALAGRVRGT